MPQFLILRLVLALTGIILALLGANVGLGGIATLGLQVEPGFVAAVDPIAFAYQDNHVRFNGGLLTAIGAFFIIGSVALERIRSVLIGLCGIIALGGLFRFSQPENPLFSDPELIRSLVMEVLFFPALAFWLWRSTVPR